MNTFPLISLLVVLFALESGSTVQAQGYRGGNRRLLQPIVPQPYPTQPTIPGRQIPGRAMPPVGRQIPAQQPNRGITNDAPAKAAELPATRTPQNPNVSPSQFPPRPQVRPTPRPVTPVDPVKAKAAKEEAVRRTIEFQKRRAAEGSATAQYDLAMRYFKGDGLEKDETAARKWFEQSAKNGNTQAKKKLDQWDKSKLSELPATGP